MQATRMKEALTCLMTGRHLCGFYAVTVPDVHRMYARKEAEGKHFKKVQTRSVLPSLFLMCQETSLILVRSIPKFDIILLLGLLVKIQPREGRL